MMKAGIIDFDVNALVIVIKVIEINVKKFEVIPSPLIVLYKYQLYPSSKRFRFVYPHV